MNDPSLSSMLRNITSSIDLDLAVTVADAINLYINAIKRNGGRSLLGPDDAVRILTIINQIQSGCAHAGDPELIPGAPARPKPQEQPQ